MTRLKLALFAMDHVAQYGIWKAGADMCGGSTRRHRADAHRNLSAQALHLMLDRPVSALHLVPNEIERPRICPGDRVNSERGASR